MKRRQRISGSGISIRISEFISTSSITIATTMGLVAWFPKRQKGGETIILVRPLTCNYLGPAHLTSYNDESKRTLVIKKVKISCREQLYTSTSELIPDTFTINTWLLAHQVTMRGSLVLSQS